MKKLILLSALIFCHFSIMAEEDCIISPNWNTQSWEQELNYLDAESRKEAILERIRCERFIQQRFPLLFVYHGIVINPTPEYRDSLLKLVRAESFTLIHWCPDVIWVRCGDVLIMSDVNNPLINNIDGLAVLDVERTWRTTRNRRVERNHRVHIRLRNEQSREFTFRIEDFNNRNNYRTEEVSVRRGRSTVRFSVSNRIKVITITDSENNVATILI